MPTDIAITAEFHTVGAWRWLPDLDFGVGTEVDTAEAFRPVYILHRAFWVLMGLLILAAGGIFVAMLFIARQHRALQKATLAARKLGQYALEEKLGAGGMGTVYKARHAMLRRPTAVKLLDVDKMSDTAIARFEREVQLTSGLTHPNTVAVFDYGRTPDGIFYYAMEYLEGMNLDDLVKRYGPLPEARLVYILRQVCGALAEAHAAGLVHRDVKPANIFLTNRGGLHDFVKVLDFGLVKSFDGEETANLTSANAMAGTPLYASPEAISQPDQVDCQNRRLRRWGRGLLLADRNTGLQRRVRGGYLHETRQSDPRAAFGPDLAGRFRPIWRDCCCVVWQNRLPIVLAMRRNCCPTSTHARSRALGRRRTQQPGGLPARNRPDMPS